MPNYKAAEQTSGSRKTVRLSPVTNEHINEFSGANITNTSGYLKNCIIDYYAGDKERFYVTQRPAIAMIEDASATVSKTAGRGIHFWSANNTRYFVNDDTVYKGDYSTPLAVADIAGTHQTALVSGTEKVYFVEWSSALNSYLFIISPENSQIFVIQDTEVVTSSSGTLGDDDLINLQDVIDGVSLAATSDAATGAGPFIGDGVDDGGSEVWDFTGLEDVIDFGFCHGAVSLDSYLFIGSKNAKIYNSAVDDFFSWNSLGVVTAERDNDQLLAIAKSKDHLVAMGERTTELFYDAANAAPASPLTPRQDIFYSIGIVNGQAFIINGDDIYSLAIKPQGDFSPYILSNFVMEEIVNSTVNSYLKHSRTEAALTPIMSGFSSGNHTYIIITLFDVNEMATISLIYDRYSKLWYDWNITLLNQEHFPLINWSIRTPETPVTAEGILKNGDIFSIDDDFDPVDATTSIAYFAEDYGTPIDTVDGYSKTTGSAATTANIEVELLLANIELDSTDKKFLHNAQYVGNQTTDSQNLVVEWSDDDGATWFSATIDLQIRNRINRLGSFERRRFRLTYSGNEQIRLEGLDATYTQGIN